MAGRKVPGWALGAVPVVVAAVVAVAVAAPGRGASDRRSPSPASVAEPATLAPPASSSAAPGGDDVRGAAAAGLDCLGQLAGLVDADAGRRRSVLESLAAPGAPGVVEQSLAGLGVLDAAVAAARTTLPGARVLVREVPLAYRVAAFSTDRARVESWSVGVVVIEGRTDATEVWSTDAVELVWSGGSWRVWAWSRQPGPVPAAGTGAPSSPAAVLDGVGTWKGLSYAPAP
ncbi:MAG TPA: hypothetical protein VFJ85_01900 [Acidimicrobiales bacterium]|nr:hypothetical protein [Acidimicrobiales bacterium]